MILEVIHFCIYMVHEIDATWNLDSILLMYKKLLNISDYATLLFNAAQPYNQHFDNYRN